MQECPHVPDPPRKEKNSEEAPRGEKRLLPPACPVLESILNNLFRDLRANRTKATNHGMSLTSHRVPHDNRAATPSHHPINQTSRHPIDFVSGKFAMLSAGLKKDP